MPQVGPLDLDEPVVKHLDRSLQFGVALPRILRVHQTGARVAQLITRLPSLVGQCH